MWSISTYNQGTFEISDKIWLSASIMLRFITHEAICMNWETFQMTWVHKDMPCAKRSLAVVIWEVFFKKKKIWTRFSVCGSQVNTKLLSLSLCQSNNLPELMSLPWEGHSSLGASSTEKREFEHGTSPGTLEFIYKSNSGHFLLKNKGHELKGRLALTEENLKVID